MATFEYSLFRTKFIKPSQSVLFYPDLTSEQIFIQAINARPNAELKEGYRWKIGNLEFFDYETGYFAMGRTTTDTIEKFDEQTGDFMDEVLDTSPHTHCVFDAKFGFVGIAKKFELSSSTIVLAERLQQLLEHTDVVIQRDVTVDVSPIPDPVGFIQTIEAAYKVKRFTATFKGPNPFDADAFFQKPLSIYCSNANAEKGQATVQGDDLNRETIVAVTRSTSATGNEASARVIKKRDQRPITIILKGNPIKRVFEEEEHHPKLVLQELTKAYKKVRHNE